MKNLILLNRLGFTPDLTTRQSRVDSVSIASRCRVLATLLLCLTLFVGSGKVWGATYTLGWGSATGTNYTNFTTTSGTVTNIVSFSTAKNSSSSNPAYNSTSSELRLYYNSGGSGGSITLTPATGVTITGFTITTSTSPTTKYKVGNGSLNTITLSSNTGSVTGLSVGSSSSITIQNCNTSNTQLRIKTIVITYTASAASHTLSSSVSPVGGGTVSLSATSVAQGSTATATATPAEHYTFTSWSITGTGASLSSTTDNPTTVTMGTANATVTATFAAAPKASITLSEAGATTTDATTYYVGDSYTLPSTTEASCGTKVLVGWSTVEVTETDTKPTSNYHEKGESVTLEATQTFYAVFATASGGGGAEWVETTIGDLTGSDIFVLATPDGYAVSNNNGTSSAPAAISITVSEGKITSSVTDAMKWNLGGNSTDGYIFYPNGTTTTWLYCNTTASSSSNNNIRVGTGDRKHWIADEDGDYVTNDTHTDRWLCNYNNADFRGYIGSSVTSDIVSKFYKYSAGTTYSAYSTNCCTPLGTINGSVSLSQLASPNPTKLKATWTMTAETGIASYTLKVYDSSDNLVKTINSYTSGSEITDLTPCTEYYVKLYTVSSGGEYCDGGLIGTSSTCTTNGYTLTVTKSNVSLSSGPEPTNICSNISATYAASDGYTLPTSISVTNAGAENTGWTWNSSTGVLTINKTSVTGNVTVTITGVPACTAPDHVNITGRWDRFGGETISLTATPYDGSGNEITTGITGYQWQKYYNSTWNNIAGATSATYTKLNCDKDDSGSYRCQVSTGATCTTASDGFQVKVYVLECYTGGITIYNFTRIGDTQAGTVQVPMNTANTGYTFKVHADNDYYGNNGTVNKDETNWVMCNNSAAECITDLTVNSGLGGTFTFTMDYSTGGSSSVLGEPELSITYPRKTIYLNPGVWNADGAKFAYYYYGVSGTGWTDFIAADACGMSADIPQWNGIKVIAVRFNPSDATPGWNGEGHVWNQTDDIVLEAGKNLITITGWSNSQTYTAYAVPTYTISYAKGSTTYTGGNEISGSKSSETKDCGVSFTLPNSAIFTTTGYTQTGWATSDGGTKAYNLGGSYTTNATQAFYPFWTVNEHTLTWTLNGGSISSAGTSAGTVAYGTSLTAPTVTKTGYTFASWSPNVPAKMPDADATYTAQWNVVNYTITYNLNSGTNPGGAPTGYNIESSAITLPTPTRTGYTFGGWYLNSSFTGDVQTTIAAGSTGNKEYWAKWIAKEYTITLDREGASTGATSVTATYDAETLAGWSAPSKTGYTFGGYWSGDNGTGTLVISTTGVLQNSVTISSVAWTDGSGHWVKDGGATVYAKWTAKDATITLNNYSGSATTTGYHFGESFTLPSTNNYSCGDKTFVGWSTETVAETDTKPTSNFYEPEESVTLAETNVFYAVFANGSAGGDFELVTDVSDLSVGDVVTIASVVGNSQSGSVIKAYASGNNWPKASVTTSATGTIAANTTDMQTFTLAEGTVSDTWAFYDGTGYIYAANTSTGDKNLMKHQTTLDAAGSFAITIADNTYEATMISQGNVNGRNDMRYNSSNNPPIFSCYASTSTLPKAYLYRQPAATGYSTTCAACEEVTVSYSDPGSGNTMSVTKGSTPIASGSSIKTCSAQSLTVTLTPATHYTVTNFEATGVTGVTTSHEGNVYTVNIPADKTGTLTLTPTFTEDAYRTIVFKSNGSALFNDGGSATTFDATNKWKQKVYLTEKPVWPTDLEVGQACDAYSKAFRGWVADGQTWSGKEASVPVGSTLITDASGFAAATSGSGDVVYHAVWAEASGSGSPHYAKVTSTGDITNGDYLIVYETGNVAFNGSLSTVDVINNYIDVTISDSKITANPTVNASKFTIDVTNKYIKSASNKYINYSKYDNGLTGNDAATAVHSMSIDGSGNFVVEGTGESGGAYVSLRYNANSDQKRFRFYKSGQNDIQLYKYDPGASYSNYLTTCCENYAVTLTGNGIVSGGTFEVSSSQPCVGSTVTLSATLCSGYTQGAWTVAKTGTPATTVTVTNNEFTMPSYAVTVSLATTAKVDHFIDRMHATTGYTGEGASREGCNYTVPSMSNTSEPVGSNCDETHYIFVGWVDSDHVGSNGALLDGYNIISGNSVQNATGTTYYAIWAQAL